MNILMVLSSHGYPPDRRVEREARDLLSEGHSVFLMALKEPGQEDEEIVDGVKVLRFDVSFRRFQILRGMHYFFIHRYLIFFRILRMCREHRIDALHVHDLPYAFATVLVGKLLHLPVVFDMHENFTVMLKTSYASKAYRKYRLLAPFQLFPLRIEERFACRWAHKVVVVAEEHVPRIVGLGAARDDIIEVTNTEDPEYFGNLSIDPEVIRRFANDFVLLYVGAFGTERGLETVVDAMPAILKRIPNARFVLVGDGFTREELVGQIETAGLQKHVTFAGYQSFKLLPSFIEAADVCIIPHISTPQIETTMPNKLFQFMILSKVVIVSNVAPMVRVVNDADCGAVFTERDPQSLAEAVVSLEDKDLRHRLGCNGRKAVEDRYKWSAAVEPLLDVYRKLRRGVSRHVESPSESHGL